MKLKKLTTAAIILAGLVCSASSFATNVGKTDSTAQISLKWAGTVPKKIDSSAKAIKIVDNSSGGSISESSSGIVVARGDTTSTINATPISFSVQTTGGGTFATGTDLTAWVSGPATVSGSGWKGGAVKDTIDSSHSYVQLQLNGTTLDEKNKINLGDKGQNNNLPVSITMQSVVQNTDLEDAGGELNVAATLMFAASLT